jgi:hypothetical protein
LPHWHGKWSPIAARADLSTSLAHTTSLSTVPLGAPQLGDDHQVAVKVTNAGGAPVTVTNYGVSMDGRKGQDNLFVTAPVPWSAKLPCSVEPGGKPAELLIPVYDLRHVSKERGIPFSRMRPWVDLGDGRRVYSRRPVPLK